MPNKPQNFWNFSLDLYDREGVASACLALQDQYQLDVNLILFCFWHGTNLGVAQEDLLQRIIDFASEWRRHVVQPLRDTRRWMKTNSQSDNQSKNQSDTQFDALRQRIKESELAAEKIQQERIAQLVNEGSSGQEPGGRAACEMNLDSLLRALGLERDEKMSAAFATIANALD